MIDNINQGMLQKKKEAGTIVDPASLNIWQ
jgi:hypothetical protein